MLWKKIVKLNTFFSKLYNNFGRKGDIYLPFLILNNFLPHLLKQIGKSIPFLHQNYGFFRSQETQISTKTHSTPDVLCKVTNQNAVS